MTAVLVILAVAVGSGLQRVTGFGFALVSGPLLVVVLPPHDGLALTNGLSGASCVLALVSTFREVRLGLAVRLIAGACVAIPLGAKLTTALPRPLLLILVGVIVVVAVGVVVRRRVPNVLTGRRGPYAMGLLAGFGNVTAGVGGVALAAYGLATQWPRATFVATSHLVLLVVNTVSLVARREAHVPAWLLGTSIVAVVVGSLAGRRLSRVMAPDAARTLVIVLAFAGGLGSVLKGVLTW